MVGENFSHRDFTTCRRSILQSGSVEYDATVVGSDVETDIAILKIIGERFKHLPFGDSDTVKQGAVVLAFGGPSGLENSLSMGVISAPARQLKPLQIAIRNARAGPVAECADGRCLFAQAILPVNAREYIIGSARRRASGREAV